MPFPIEEKYIEETEKKLDVKFPDSYKQNMKSINGGEIENEDIHWIFYPFFDKSSKKRIYNEI